MTEASTPRPFADHVVDYALAGWPCVLPVPPTEKYPPPVGYTGAEGRDTDALQLVEWAGHLGHYSIALRMPEGVIGIDVDSYLKGEVQKRGAETLAAYVERWGPLPATWTSTARGEGPSRIHFFRVPAQRYATKLATGETGDVEVIQRHHRYAVVWPSPNPQAGGATYRWYDPTGAVVDAPPKPEELTELPPVWVAGLAEGATDAGPAAADAASGAALLDQLRDDVRTECAEITSARQTALAELGKSDAGSRHDAMTSRTHHLVQLAASGHTGVGHALLELADAWAALTAGEERAEEFERALLTSARKAVTAVGQHQVPRDPCLLTAGGFAAPAPAPGDPGAGADPELQIVELPRWASTREVIGTHAFDPNAGLDQTLAEAVLARAYPAVRYAYDSDGWLLRCPERWELHKRLSPWAVAQVASLMPVGDPTAEKGSEPQARAQRRTRLMSTAGARAVASKMDDLVAGGMHPAAVALADLDAEPDVLWAGGHPWSLRGSLERPAPADLDPTTPHQHTAAMAPEVRPTPLWDAFLAAVWPDPELRAWAVRVLSIAMTGYADRALPILLGETGRGKTQVIHLLMSVLGSYAHAADPRLMSPAGETAHASIVYALKGRRLSFIDEGPREGRLAQERLKQLTGGGELTANQMNQNPITFRPTHTLVLTTNDEPPLTDPAVRARARLIPCEGDPELVRTTRAAIGHVSGQAWRSEAPGVLAALMSEAAAWLADPTTAHVTAAPEGVRYLAEHLGAEQDPVQVWLEEETEPTETGTPSRELYQAFTASCLRNNLRRDAIPSETKWGRAVTRLGYPTEHTRSGKIRRLRLRSGGFLPGMGTTPSSGHETSGPPPAERDGCDGLVTGSPSNPSQPFSQVNPSVSVAGDGCDGLEQFPHTCAPAHTRAGGAEVETGPNPSPQNRNTGVDLQEQGPPNPSPEPVTPDAEPTTGPAKAKPARKRTEQTESAREKRAAEKRRLAVAEAAGAMVQLPAVVTRDGSVRAVALQVVDDLLATITSVGAALTVDVEHTGYPIGHEHYALRTVQLGGETFAAVLDPTDPDQAGVVRRHLAAAAQLHAHSATADLVPLAVADLIDPEAAWAKMLDTGVLAKLADPASTGNDADLKSLARNVLGSAATSPAADAARAALFKAGGWLTEVEVTTPPERSGWAQVDPGCETQVRYAASDVLDCAALARLLPRPEPAVLARELAVQQMTARITNYGVRLDGDQVHRLLDQHRTARSEHAEQVSTLSAGAIANPGSSQQVAAALEQLGAQLPRTPKGKPSVAKGVLEPLRGTEGPVGDLARAVLDYRHHNTALVLLLEPYQELVTRGDGRARPTVYTLGADTGRMSSSRPNVQQVSREGGMRACFVADPGEMLVSADFAGVELRVAAALSGDAGLAAIMADPDRDLHWEIARLAFGPNATKAQRYAIKRGVFGRIYGGGVGAVAGGVGVSHSVAKQVIDAMDALTPQLAAWSQSVRDGIEVGRTRFPTYAGRVIHLPTAAPHAGPNYCIQGTARELLVDALLRWQATPWGGRPLFPVHDELVVMVPEAEAQAATAALVECMTTELYGVPIIAEASTPTHAWADSA